MLWGKMFQKKKIHIQTYMLQVATHKDYSLIFSENVNERVNHVNTNMWLYSKV